MKALLLLPLALLVACAEGGSTGPAPDPVTVATTSLPDGVVGTSYNTTLAASGGTGSYAWSVGSGSLPAGLTLAAGGAITGTPSAAGTGSFTVRATSGTESGTRSLSITIAAPEVVITTSALANGSAGTAYSQTLSATGGTGTFAWTLAGGALPAGLTLSSGGVISGTPTAGGTSSFTVQAASGGRTASKGLSITVAYPAVSVTTTTLADGTVGTAYTQGLAAAGGTGAYSWALESGTLPAGLTLYASGSISGTPTAAGTSNFTVQVASGTQTATRALSITVQQPQVTITTGSLPGGAVGQAYSQTLAATGGVGGYAWSIASGALPAGLSLSAAGVISGTPTTAGTSNFSIRVTSGAQNAVAAFTIIVQPPPVTITTTSPLPPAVQGTPYSQALAATGGTGGYTWALTAGSLPAGLALSAGGVISGTPTAQGTSTFTVRATSGAQSATRDLMLTVQPPTLTVTTTILPGGVVGDPYSQQLAASGGTGSYTWALAAGSGPLPGGLNLSAAGQISGTPAAQGTFVFTVQVTSGAQSATQALSITIGATVPAVTVTTSGLPAGNVGEVYSASLSATGGTGTYTWTLAAGSGPLPAGLGLLTSGTISGTPTAVGTSVFTVQAESGGKTGTKSLSITIDAALPAVVISTTSLPDATVGAFYSQQLAATGGTGNFTWSLAAGSLPGGIALSSTGALTGTPAAAGTYNFTVRAVSGSQNATQALSLTVAPAALTITSGSPLPSGTVTVAYNRTLTATGGIGGYTWSLTGGSLPAGLGLSGAGVISGTPTAAGTSNFTVQVTSGAQSTSKSFDLTINAVPPVDITTLSLSNATVGTAYSRTLTATGGLGAGTYSWTVSAGSLPAGLTLSAAGVISGTPTTAGTSNFTVQATSGGQSDTQALSLTVDAAGAYTITLNVGASPTASVTAGNNISIPIGVDLSQIGSENLGSLQVKIAWDVNRFDWVSATPGDWAGALVYVNSDNAASGYVIINGLVLIGTTTSFTLQTLTLAAKATASQITSPVTASDIIAANDAIGALTVTPRNLTVTINP